MTIEERIQQIKGETKPKANTASRVGEALEGLKGHSEEKATQAESNSKEYTDDKASLLAKDYGTFTPQLEDIYGKKYRDTSFKRFRVDGEDIQRIHDLINDPERDCVWGITRKDGGFENYCFRIDRDGTIIKTSIGTNGFGKGMHMTWGGDDIWIGDIHDGGTDVGRLIKVDPDTLEVNTYSLPNTTNGACAVTWDNGFVMVSEYVNTGDGTSSKIYKFNPETEQFTEFIVNDIIQLYWALFDGSVSWFAGGNPINGNASLVKIDLQGNYTVYDLGDGSSGSEITYDGTHIWYGSNVQTKNILIRFNPSTEEIKIIPLPDGTGQMIPRLVGFDGKYLWLVDTANHITRMQLNTFEFEYFKFLDGMNYSHGLTFDGKNAWVGNWQDTCYIWRIPMTPIDIPPYSYHMVTFNEEGNLIQGGTTAERIKYAGTTTLDSNEIDTQIPVSNRFEIIGLSVSVKSNTCEGSVGAVPRINGADQAPTVIIPSGETGFFQDNKAININPRVLNEGDRLSVRLFSGSTGSGEIVFGKITVTLYDRGLRKFGRFE